MGKRIGVLAVQGAFAEHREALNRLGAENFEIRKKSDLTTMDGLILPGGESTVIGKLLKELELFEPLKQAIHGGLPVFGTCAGMILLANNISNDNNRYFCAMDITVRRNAYGRQLGSFRTEGYFTGIGEIPMTFIRAPYIEEVSGNEQVQVLALIEDHIVAARQKNILVTSFHPELTDDISVHRYWYQEMVLGSCMRS
jgi:5'-phosphate synthase pdxT subunit